jgi:hypothetical protein
MGQRDELGFAWSSYLPEHRMVIALAFKRAKRLTRCSLCQRRPVRRFTALCHQAPKGLDADRLDPKTHVRALALCRAHAQWTDEALGDVCWPGWRERWG